MASFRDFFGCWTGDLASELADTQTAVNVASQFGGSGDVTSLVNDAKAVKALGWMTVLWPVFQLGIGNDVDKINELLSGGESALVTYHMDPVPPSGNGGSQAPGPGSSGGSGGGQSGGTPTVTLAQGPAAPAGYRYAVQLTGFPANSNVSVTCYDSVSTGGFYTFTMRTDGGGSAFTQSQCYSGDGPDHWVVAGGLTSNHVQWSAAAPSPPPPPLTRKPPAA